MERVVERNGVRIRNVRSRQACGESIFPLGARTSPSAWFDRADEDVRAPRKAYFAVSRTVTVTLSERVGAPR